MSRLTCLPPEILHYIFVWLCPEELLLLRRVCSLFYGYVRGNQRLHRAVYLQYFDTPEDAKLDWEAELQDIVRLTAICRGGTSDDKARQLDVVSSTVIRLLKRASSRGHTTDNSLTHCASRNAEYLAALFEDRANREAFLQRSSLFARVRSTHRDAGPEPSGESSQVAQRQQSAKLHCLYGRPILNLGRLRSTQTYPFAVSKVYDLREYTELTRWGPFMDDTTRRVDWEKMEAIVVALGYNMTMRRITKLFGDVWDSPFSGSWPKSYMPSPKAALSTLDAQDPYGVTGTWFRVVCFLDYHDFFNFNFPVRDMVRDGSPRPPLGVGEETRLILMRTRMTGIEPPGPDDGQDLPVVHFVGESRSLNDSWDDNANSDLRAFTSKGIVRLTKEGEVRWTTTSIFHGEERWRSEGIQVGGIRSGRGVVGSWFDKDRDPHGPAGPTAFWKASDCEGAANTVQGALTSDFLLAYSTVAYLDDSDPEAEMDYDDDDDDDDDDMDDDMDEEPISNELTELLMDAQLDVADIMQQQGANQAETS